MNPDDMDLGELYRFYEFIGSLICEEVGHKWNTLSPGNTTTNTCKYDKCRVCGETRQIPVNSNDATEIEIDGEEIGTLRNFTIYREGF